MSKARSRRCLSIAIVASLAITIGSCDSVFNALEQKRMPARYLIPDGYVGWVQIDMGVNGAPPPAREGAYLVFQIPRTGHLVTSAHLEEGWAYDQYFYCDNTGNRRRLPETGWGGGGMVWAGSTGDSVSDGVRSPSHYRFFVGTEDQYHKAP